MSRDYVIAVQAPAYPVSPTETATESAFASHLRELARIIGPEFDRVVLIAPRMTDEQYTTGQHQLGALTVGRDRVAFMPAHDTSMRARRFWFGYAWPLWRRIRGVVRSAAVVHSGVSDDIWRPLMAMVNLAAWLDKKPLVFVVDIDFRQHTRRYFQLGIWGWRSYLVNRLVYDPLVWLQVWAATRMCQLVLLKSASMVRDFGRGRSHVRNFYDAAHAPGDVLPEAEVQGRLDWIGTPGTPLQLVYFGRLVRYKGLDRTIEAVRLARSCGEDVRLTIIGDGDQRTELMRQVADGDLAPWIGFEAAVPYGPVLFERLRGAHLMIATPLVEDTPRAALDALARGIPILAFDLTYFRDLQQDSGAVLLARWPDAQSVADRLVEVSRNRLELAGLSANGLSFARRNTQPAWLALRTQWVREVAFA